MAHPVIRALFEELDAALARPTPRLNDFTTGSVFIYGAGNVGRDVFALLAHRGVTVRGFLDRAARPGDAWQGVPIWAPDDPQIRPIDRRAIPVVVGIFNAYVEMPPIHRSLQTLGYSQVTPFLSFYDEFAQELGDRFWLTSRSFYHGVESALAECYELWSDEVSRTLFAAVLRFRFTHDYEGAPPPELGQQYFPAALPPYPSPLRFVDCGAFDGDTLRQLVATGIPVEAIAAFEPDPENFRKLTGWVRAAQGKLPESLSLFPCGVDSATRQVRFTGGHGSGSHASDRGDTVVQCVSLDEALPRFRPTVIKMDIEGAEYAALWGARGTISEHRPALAICLYHRPADLWRIPLLIRQLAGGGGRFHLRVHCYNGFELVLYWRPD